MWETAGPFPPALWAQCLLSKYMSVSTYWEAWEMGRCPQHAGTSASSFSEPAEADGCSDAVMKPEYTWEGVSPDTLLSKGIFFFFFVQNRQLVLVQNGVTVFSHGGCDRGCWVVLPNDQSMLLCKTHLAHGTCSDSCSMSHLPTEGTW